jgi:SEC-C motif
MASVSFWFMSGRHRRTFKTWFFGYRFWDVLGLNTWKADAALGGIPGTRRHIDRVGRNTLCPCGSGKKFKRCHGTGWRHWIWILREHAEGYNAES